MRTLLGLFLVAHGLLHLAIWLPSMPTKDRPFDPNHSWVLQMLGMGPRAQKLLSAVLAVVAAVMFVVAGVALLVDSELWRSTTLLGALASLLLVVVYFTRWLSFAFAINVTLAVMIWTSWPSPERLGA